MATNIIEQWLSGAIGLDAHTLGPQTVANAVKRRMAACNLTKESDYLERLNTAPDLAELLALIETIVVPETWFFRDREPFVFLAKYVSATWLAAHPHERLQVLSLPCASGEEPYSIAMTLQSAGLPPERYRIDAVDINPASLRKAEKGVYGPNSFRSGLLAHCERYFKIEGAARIVNPEVRAGIRFIQGNIMGAPEFAAEQTYDIVFCRNLLIYQHIAARGQIIATLDRLLKPGGLLFVGHAETMALLMDRYEPVRHSGVFAYCKFPAKPCNAGAEFVNLIGPIKKATVSCSRGGLLRRSSERSLGDAVAAEGIHALTGAATKIAIPTVSCSRGGDDVAAGPTASPLPTPASRLERARVLADQGRLDEAATMCQDLLRENPQLAEAHLLLGVIRTAAGQAQAAEECLSHALYLDADCHEALIHLSLLKARRGDEAGAERLRRHAARIRDL
ncbi:MAG: protein-glutamate O-methyltransferase CheR, partial [Kiritimatiellia bacterium]